MLCHALIWSYFAEYTIFFCCGDGFPALLFADTGGKRAFFSRGRRGHTAR